MDKNFVINIGRQLGSGGRMVGEILSKKLNIAFYDKELIQLASQKSGLGKEFFEKVDEQTTHSIWGGLLGYRGASTEEYYSNTYLCNESLFNIQSEVIRELAEKQPCIFVGRCADYVLKDHPLALNVFICANIEDRIQRIMNIQQLSEKKALDFIEKTDKKRAGYYNYYSNKIWGNADSYHLCINSSVLGIDETVDFILRFAMKKFDMNYPL